jgi:hypothetical protein
VSGSGEVGSLQFLAERYLFQCQLTAITVMVQKHHWHLCHSILLKVGPCYDIWLVTHPRSGWKTQQAHSHAIWLHWHCLTTFGRRGGKCVPAVIIAYIEGPSTIHILLELGCIPAAASDMKGKYRERNAPMAVSASATCAN